MCGICVVDVGVTRDDYITSVDDVDVSVVVYVDVHGECAADVDVDIVVCHVCHDGKHVELV